MRSETSQMMPSSDASPGDGRNETLNERADRNWDELLQELRVLQTGTQILGGFLLAVAFQSRFTDLDAYQVWLYVVLVALATLATVLALTPVSIHRLNFGRQRKPAIVTTASRITIATLGVVGALTVGVATLIVDFVVGRGAGIVTSIVGVGLVSLAWFVVPRMARRQRDERGP